MAARARARARRTRTLAALALAALTALGVTGCQDGTGVRDEGPAKIHARSLHAPEAAHTVARTGAHIMKRPPGSGTGRPHIAPR
jgi:hypothetical protein